MKKFIAIGLISFLLLFSIGLISAGNFTELDTVITDAQVSEDSVILNDNYKWNNGEDVSGIVINKENFVVDGNNFIIDGSNNARIFNITGNNVTIKNLNLINGYTNGSGSAIYSLYGLNIQNSNFTNNNASTDHHTYGGAVYVNGALIVTDSTFTNNTAHAKSGGHAFAYGGAVYATGNITIINSAFTNNNAYGNAHTATEIYVDAATSGGAVYTDDNIIVTGSTFTNNNVYAETYTEDGIPTRAYAYGGAIYTVNNMIVTDSTFTNNSANAKTYTVAETYAEASGDGGAIYTYSGSVTIINSDFTNNNIYAEGEYSAGVYGGAIYTRGSEITVIGSTFTNNNAHVEAVGYNYADGGAIRAVGNLTLINSTFKNNSATSNGGAINTFYDLTLINSTFIYNSANNDGGATYAQGFTNIWHSVFINNTASHNGGVIYGGVSNIYGSFFQGNNPNGNSSIYMYFDLNISMNYNVFLDNSIVHQKGIGNIDFNNNWWGTNNHTLIENKFNAINYDLDNYFVMNLSSNNLNDKHVGDNFNFDYGLYLNGTNNNVNVSNLPLFTVNLTLNGNNFNNIYDARYNKNLNITLTNLINNISAFSYNEFITNLIVNAEPAIIKIETILSAENITMIYGDGTRYTVTLKDIKGNPISNTPLTINLNGRNYTITTNNNGIATLNINIAPGIYNVLALFKGSDMYLPGNTTSTINILENENYTYVNINARNITMFFRNGTQYTVTLTHLNGTPIVNASIIININGQDYIRYTNNNGIASMNINLQPNIYTVIATFNGTDKLYSNSVVTYLTVLPTLEADDLIKYYLNDSQFYVSLVDGQGHPLKNTNISFNINGIMYTRGTNESGIAKLTINLVPGEYIITSEHNGLKISNSIIVLADIIVQNLTKYFINDSQYFITVLDAQGNPLANKVVSVNINGIFYNRSTNASGIAKLTINLNPGTYIATAIHPLTGLMVSSIVIVKTTLIGEDLTKQYGQEGSYNIKVLNHIGNPYPNQVVKININGVFYERTSDSNGIAKLAINLNPGSYIATATWNGLSTSNTITVNP